MITEETCFQPILMNFFNDLLYLGTFPGNYHFQGSEKEQQDRCEQALDFGTLSDAKIVKIGKGAT